MKQCFKCLNLKDISEFYKHSKMADGHLNKCKDCAKLDSNNLRLEKEATDLDWVISERKRHLEKSRLSRLNGTSHKSSKDELYERTISYRNKHPDKYAAQTMVNNYIRDGKIKKQSCEVCSDYNAQAHHDDYSKPLEIRWLCVKHHNEHHVKERDLKIIESF